MLNRKTAIETANSFISELKMLGYNPNQAWLFGSVISGKTHAYSDIDLALWDNNFSGVMHFDAEKIKKLLLKYRLIELHSYHASTTEDDDPFVGEIKKTGVQIL